MRNSQFKTHICFDQSRISSSKSVTVIDVRSRSQHFLGKATFRKFKLIFFTFLISASTLFQCCMQHPTRSSSQEFENFPKMRKFQPTRRTEKTLQQRISLTSTMFVLMMAKFCSPLNEKRGERRTKHSKHTRTNKVK